MEKHTVATKTAPVRIDYRGYVSTEASRAIHCDFWPRNGGYTDRCREVAVWQAGWTNSKGEWHANQYGSLRCDRHRRIDERTAARRPWSSDTEYRPFDPQAAYDAALARIKAAREQAEEAFWYDVKHAATKRDLDALRALAKRGPHPSF